jgi:hypothetical protein
MAEKHLRREPQHPSIYVERGRAAEDFWFYEENAGLCLVRAESTEHLLIPWRYLREAVARKDRDND